jgi:hypothetical protein
MQLLKQQQHQQPHALGNVDITPRTWLADLFSPSICRARAEQVLGRQLQWCDSQKSTVTRVLYLVEVVSCHTGLVSLLLLLWPTDSQGALDPTAETSWRCASSPRSSMIDAAVVCLDILKV